MLLDGKIGCTVCKTISNIDMFRDRGMHLSKKWINCQSYSDAVKSVAGKPLGKKIVKRYHNFFPQNPQIKVFYKQEVIKKQGVGKKLKNQYLGVL